MPTITYCGRCFEEIDFGSSPQVGLRTPQGGIAYENYCERCWKHLRPIFAKQMQDLKLALHSQRELEKPATDEFWNQEKANLIQRTDRVLQGLPPEEPKPPEGEEVGLLTEQEIHELARNPGLLRDLKLRLQRDIKQQRSVMDFILWGRPAKPKEPGPPGKQGQG